MTRNLPEWAYLVDERGRHWHHLATGTRQAATGPDAVRPPARAVFGIPTNDLVSVPQWISSKDSDIIAQVVAAEAEKLGGKSSRGPGKTTDWKAVEYNGTRTLVHSVAIPWAFEELETIPSEFTDFLPQYALYPPPDDAVALWRERDSWVAGYSRSGHWVHVQSLEGSDDPVSLGAEITLTLMELSAKGISLDTTKIVVWSNYDLELHRALQEETGLFVEFDERPSPSPSASPEWQFEPHEVSIAKLKQRQRRRGAWLAFAGLLFIGLLAVAAVLHIWTLENFNERLREKVALNTPAAAGVESTIERWQTLSPAIEPARSVVELFHRVSTLLPETGFRLTAFEVQNFRTIVVRGEGSAMANALQFKGALEAAPDLSDYEWEIPPPRPKDDLTEFFATGTYRF
ncbi:MAG: hypothetical protein WD342_20940 [Verrucomicrobiales bacterium]